MFETRVVALAPGCARPYVADEWLDAIVVVACGELEIECARGRRRRFAAGDLLWLAALPLRALANPGDDLAMLVVISRRRGSDR